MMEEDGGSVNARKSVNKSLLKNIMRHTDAHNKIQEQNEMWKHWELKKQYRERDNSYHNNVHPSRKRGYMRSDVQLSAAKKESLKWNCLLMEYEEARKDRWGHSGYKELYPDEFLERKSNEIVSDESETTEAVKIKDIISPKEKGGKKEHRSKKIRPGFGDVKTAHNMRKSSAAAISTSSDAMTRNCPEERGRKKESGKNRSDSAKYKDTKFKKLDSGFNTGCRKREITLAKRRDSRKSKKTRTYLPESDAEVRQIKCQKIYNEFESGNSGKKESRKIPSDVAEAKSKETTDKRKRDRKKSPRKGSRKLKSGFSYSDGEYRHKPDGDYKTGNRKTDSKLAQRQEFKKTTTDSPESEVENFSAKSRNFNKVKSCNRERGRIVAGGKAAVTSDSSASDTKSGRMKSVKLNNEFKSRSRLIGSESPESDEKAQSQGYRDRGLKYESSETDEIVEQSCRKRHSDDTSKKSRRTCESTSKKKKKVRH